MYRLPYPVLVSHVLCMGSIIVLGLDARAWGQAAPNEPLEYQLPPSIVIANRIATPVDRIGSAFGVIDGDTLEAQGVHSIADALQQMPGVSISRSGGLGSLTDIRIRGAENNHTLVLIDGVEANDPAISAFDFGHLMNLEIERIEILRGPQSALWGSDAIGGVINIITRAGRGAPQLSAALEAGSFQTANARFALGGSTESTEYRFGVGFIDSDGFSIAPGGSEDDGYRNTTLSAKLRYALTDTLALDWVTRYIDAEKETDPQDFAFPPTPSYGQVIDGDDIGETTHWFSRLQATLDRWDDRWEHIVGVSLTDTNNAFFTDGEPTNQVDGRKLKIDYQSTLFLPTEAADHTFSLALEHEREDFSQRGESAQSPANQDQALTTKSVIGEYQLAYGEHWNLTAAARYDDNERFDDATTYRLTAAWLPSRGDTRVHASLGSGTKNPTFTELFGFFPSSFVGNPDLTPEKARSVDVGVERRWFDDRLTIDVTAFRSRFEEEIITTFDSDTFLSSVENSADDSDRRGVEIDVRAALSDRIDLRAQYTFTRAKDPEGLAELRRPEHSASVSARYTSNDERLTLGADVVFVGKRNDLFFGTTPAERVELDAYTLVNVSGTYAISDDIKLYGRIENLFDESYQEVYGYATGGVGAFVGVKLDY